MIRVPEADDRGRTVRVPITRIGWVYRLWRSRLDTSHRGLRRALWRTARRPAVWLAVVGVLLLMALVLLTLKDTATGLGLLIISPVAMPLLALALVTARGLIGLGRELPPRLRGDTLAMGRCPVCNYDLLALTAEADACVTCPECGAAWNWDAIGDRGGREAEVVVIDRATPVPPRSRDRRPFASGP